jgi:proline iminopeptidase
VADDVAALCSLLGIEHPVVLGHSAGGFVALQLALDHPELVAGLILCDTAASLAPTVDDDAPPGLGERAGTEAVAIAERLFGGDFSPETVAAFASLVAPHYAGPAHVDVPGRLLALSSLDGEIASHFVTQLAPRYDLRPRLHEIVAPTLVIVGRYDWVCPPAASRLIAASIAGAELLEVREAGHFAFSETPDAFVPPVRKLIREVGRRERA